jgi:hypothetical protein
LQRKVETLSATTPINACVPVAAMEILEAVGSESNSSITGEHFDYRLWLARRLVGMLLSEEARRFVHCKKGDVWKLEHMRSDLGSWAIQNNKDWPELDDCLCGFSIDIQEVVFNYYAKPLVCYHRLHVSCFADTWKGKSGNRINQPWKCLICHAFFSSMAIMRRGVYIGKTDLPSEPSNLDLDNVGDKRRAFLDNFVEGFS